MMASPFYKNSTNLLEWPITDKDGAAVTDATVTVTVTDQYGQELGGETWPLSLPHDTGGLYSAAVSSAAEIVLNRKYTATFVAIQGTKKRTKTLELVGAL